MQRGRQRGMPTNEVRERTEAIGQVAERRRLGAREKMGRRCGEASDERKNGQGGAGGEGMAKVSWGGGEQGGFPKGTLQVAGGEAGQGRSKVGEQRQDVDDARAGAMGSGCSGSHSAVGTVAAKRDVAAVRGEGEGAEVRVHAARKKLHCRGAARVVRGERARCRWACRNAQGVGDAGLVARMERERGRQQRGREGRELRLWWCLAWADRSRPKGVEGLGQVLPEEEQRAPAAEKGCTVAEGRGGGTGRGGSQWSRGRAPSRWAEHTWEMVQSRPRVSRQPSSGG
ncbi:hypothetical protein BDU57DRAFT_357276 [Ampelomyces quisqualis]|uniref:Uncharacterized protein n=1 Tax=Ampelomyces quisqualis TaxID=50730 RepID=A0A6A5QA14_AMPQU|nr:hypothetical protein BDU57DRAFT_357276 [Ampelomyces quisqualis]